MYQKSNDRFNLRQLFDTPTELLVESSNPMWDVSNTTGLPPLDTLEARRSGRIVRALDRFMFLGEVIFDEYDLQRGHF